MALFGSRRNQVVRRRADGGYDLVLDPVLRDTMRALLDELHDLIAAGPDDPGLRRLRPPAYADDPDRDAEYQLLAGDELRSSRQAAIVAVQESLGAHELSDSDLWAWLQSLNALRLVVGTRLGIDDEEAAEAEVSPDDPAAALWAIYQFSTWVQHEVVRALRD